MTIANSHDTRQATRHHLFVLPPTLVTHPALCSARSPSQPSLSLYRCRTSRDIRIAQPSSADTTSYYSSTRCLENPVAPHRAWNPKSLDRASVGRTLAVDWTHQDSSRAFLFRLRLPPSISESQLLFYFNLALPFAIVHRCTFITLIVHAPAAAHLTTIQ